MGWDELGSRGVLSTPSTLHAPCTPRGHRFPSPCHGVLHATPSPPSLRAARSPFFPFFAFFPPNNSRGGPAALPSPPAHWVPRGVPAPAPGVAAGLSPLSPALGHQRATVTFTTAWPQGLGPNGGSGGPLGGEWVRGSFPRSRGLSSSSVGSWRGLGRVVLDPIHGIPGGHCYPTFWGPRWASSPISSTPGGPRYPSMGYMAGGAAPSQLCSWMLRVSLVTCASSCILWHRGHGFR